MPRILVADEDNIVAMSGWKRGQRSDHLAVARHAGASFVLRKPFKLDELLEQLRNRLPRNHGARK